MSLPSVGFIWAFEVNPAFPIIKVYGVSQERNIEPIAMSLAINFIDKAQKFQGVLYPNHEVPKNKQVPLMVSFSLIFKTHRDLHDYINSIKHQG